MSKRFLGDTYSTPTSIQRRMADRLSLGSKWGFMAMYLPVVLRSRRAALNGRYDRQSWERFSNEIFDLVEGCGGVFDIRGLENIPRSDEAVIFAGNHMSTLETLVFPALILPRTNVTFVAKESLVRNFLFGPTIGATDPIVVSRKDPILDFKKIILEGGEKIKKNKSVVVFPQSTRSRSFNQSEFNSLAVKLARSVGVRIVPFALKTDFWGMGKLLKEIGPINRKEPINITFGPSISVVGNGKEAQQQLVEFIKDQLTQWRVQVN